MEQKSQRGSGEAGIRGGSESCWRTRGWRLDTANQDPALIAATVRLTDLVPNLRVVIDHLPQLEPPVEQAAHRAYEANLRELGKRPQVYVKISEVLRRVDGRVPEDLKFYRRGWTSSGNFRRGPAALRQRLAEQRSWAPYPQVLKIVREYFTSERAGGGGEILLEEFHGGVPLGEAGRAAAGFTTETRRRREN